MEPFNFKDQDDKTKILENHFGLITGFYLYGLHEIATAAGSQWNINDPDTMDIPVNNLNAADVYGYCRAIRSEGWSAGINKAGMRLIKQARDEAHKFLVAEANNPTTSIERKIELVKLTSH